MTTYWCEACGKECTPVLREVGPAADCCEEARLMFVTSEEDGDGFMVSVFRLLTRFEEQELAYELHDEADAERTPAERARHRVMGEP